MGLYAVGVGFERVVDLWWAPARWGGGGGWERPPGRDTFAEDSLLNFHSKIFAE